MFESHQSHHITKMKNQSSHKIRHINEYRVIYKPDHPKAMTSDNWNGWIYEHIYIAEKYFGRALRDDEVVHHLDGNRENNHFSNLLVLPKESHAKLHMWIDSGVPFGTSTRELTYCKVCGITLQSDQDYYCSIEHFKIDTSKVQNRPTKEELLKLLQKHSYCAVGRMFDVSDNAIRKWVKRYGVDPKSIKKD